MTNQTQTSTLGSVSFLNIFGILISIILCVLFIIMGGHTIKYIKAFAVKIKIIANRADDKNIQLRKYDYKPPAAKSSQVYLEMETIFKNQIKKSRSLEFKNILRSFMAMYDHIVFFPFRNKIEEQYDLLRPKLTFFNLLILTSCIISWMVTIFLSSILSFTYSDISLISVGIFIGVTVGISVISSLLNVIAINRLFALYQLNVKGAFNVHYGNQFVSLANGDLVEYIPQNKDEEDMLFGAPNQDNYNEEQNLNLGPRPNIQISQFEQPEDDVSAIETSRKLLKVEDQPSDSNHLGPKTSQNLNGEQSLKSNLMSSKGKTLSDIFGLQVNIQDIANAGESDKYVFVEDIHAIGDHELLNNEGTKGENRSNVITLMVMFIIIAFAAGVCCYLNYTFDSLLARNVFFMFIGSFFGDILIFRTILCLIFSVITFARGKKTGYSKIQYKQPKEIQQLHLQATIHIEEKRKQRLLALTKSFTNHKSKQENLSPMKIEDNTFARDKLDLSLQSKVKIQDEDEKAADEDQQAQYEGGTDENEFEMVSMPAEHEESQREKSKIELAFEKKYGSNQPLLLDPALIEADDEKHANIMYQKYLFDPLADYNLFLLRKIYDAFDERGDKVVKQFRSDRNNVIRKRYMVPILNPNYDYDKLMLEMKHIAPEKFEDEHSVHLDGMTVCDDEEKFLMEAIIQEGMDDLVQEKVERQKIDKFGNAIDKDKLKNGADQITQNLPFFGTITMEAEEIIEEDDEEARWMREMMLLKQRLAQGESLTQEELDYLEMLENRRIAELMRLIEEVKKKKPLENKDLLQINGYEQEIVNLQLDQLYRKKNKTPEDFLRIKELEHKLKLLKLEELRLKQKMGILTKEEEELLRQLEEEMDMLELEELRRKKLDGTITEEELRRLKELEQKYGLFEEQEELNQEFLERQSEIDENFADLPALEVINNLKSTEEEQLKQQTDVNQKLVDLHTLENQEMLDESILKSQRMVEEAKQETLNLIQQQHDQNIGKVETQNQDHNQQLTEVQQQLLLQEQMDLNQKQKQIERKAQEELERAKTPEERKAIQEQVQEEIQKLDSQRSQGQKLLEEIEQQQQVDEQLKNLEAQRLLEEQKQAEQQKKIEQQAQQELKKAKTPKQKKEIEEKKKASLKKLEEQQLKNQAELDQKQSELESKRRSSLLEEQEAQRKLEEQRLENERLIEEQKRENERLIEEQNRANLQQLEELREQNQRLLNEQTLQNQILIDEQAKEKQRLLEEQQMIEQQSIKDRKLLEEQKLEKQRLLEEQEAIQKRLEEQQRENLRMLQEQERENARLLEEQRLRNLQLIEEQNKEKQRMLDEQNKSFQKQLSQMSFHSRIDQNESYEASQGENPFEQQEEQVHLRNSDLSEEYPSRLQSRGQEQFNQQLVSQPMEEEYDHGQSPKPPIDDIRFGHEDLVAAGNEESIYSHKTTTILNDSKVSFVHIEQMPHEDNESDEGQYENDMVYYYKDDLTNYSRPLDLNKVKVKQPQNSAPRGGNYFTDNDLPEVSENEKSESGEINQSVQRSQRSYDPNRSRMGRGKIQHGEVEIIDDGQFVDGRVKVDSWNLNYTGKKKKFRKKKVTQAQKKKMSDLQNIYGVDAETLAGLSKGRLPRKLIAGGKFGKEKKGGSPSPGQGDYSDENSFRSTKNTFMTKGNPASNQKLKQSAIDAPSDVQSNLFSFNGYGTSHRWNDIKSTLNGQENPLLNSRQDLLNSKLKQNQGNKFGFKNKLTASQQNFNRGDDNQGDSRGFQNRLRNKNNFMEEESKSRSSKGSLPRGIGKQNYASNQPAKQGIKMRKSDMSNNSQEEVESRNHSESDEAVDDRGAIFQNRNAIKDYSGKIQANRKGSDQELDHSESEEGNNRDNPNFDGNDLMFKKRDHSKQLQSQPGSNSKAKQDNSNTNGFAQDFDDLEAQVLSKRSKAGKDHERSDDSEGENLGGDVRFQDRNRMNEFQTSQITKKGNAQQQVDKKYQSQQNKGAQGRQPNSRLDKAERNQLQVNVETFSNNSDNARQYARNAYGSTDGDHSNGGPRLATNKMHLNGSNSNPNLLGPNKNLNSNKKQGRRVQSDDYEEDKDEDQFIVGPNSNHSKIRQRNFNQQQEEEERYLLLMRERQIQEDIENDKRSTNGLAKQRKIRKAAHSQDPRANDKLRQKQIQDLQRMKREAENALFANEENDLERGRLKQKKKIIKKETVKKEINYWLDYDSPYAEYLVARFREWSPNTGLQHKGPASQGSNQRNQKMNEVSNIYHQEESRSRSGSKQQPARNQERKLPKAIKPQQQKLQNQLRIDDFEEP